MPAGDRRAARWRICILDTRIGLPDFEREPFTPSDHFEIFFYTARSQYRLRVGEIRVFCDIREHVVEVLAIVPKTEASSWLDAMGE
ncbi:MAG: hypothetical protein WAV26_12905 [Candidatus Deferrimicrobium sp.]